MPVLKEKDELVCLYDLEEETDIASDVGESDLNMSATGGITSAGHKNIITCNSSPMVREKVLCESLCSSQNQLFQM